jgi:hypothetical protein
MTLVQLSSITNWSTDRVHGAEKQTAECCHFNVCVATSPCASRNEID